MKVALHRRISVVDRHRINGATWARFRTEPVMLLISRSILKLPDFMGVSDSRNITTLCTHSLCWQHKIVIIDTCGSPRNLMFPMIVALQRISAFEVLNLSRSLSLSYAIGFFWACLCYSHGILIMLCYFLSVWGHGQNATGQNFTVAFYRAICLSFVCHTLEMYPNAKYIVSLHPRLGSVILQNF